MNRASEYMHYFREALRITPTMLWWLTVAWIVTTTVGALVIAWWAVFALSVAWAGFVIAIAHAYGTGWHDHMSYAIKHGWSGPQRTEAAND